MQCTVVHQRRGSVKRVYALTIPRCTARPGEDGGTKRGDAKSYGSRLERFELASFSFRGRGVTCLAIPQHHHPSFQDFSHQLLSAVPLFGPPDMTCAGVLCCPRQPTSLAGRSAERRTQRCVQRMLHTLLQLSAIAPMIRASSQREPTCRFSKSLNLGERRSPTWSNGRHMPSSPLPASPC